MGKSCASHMAIRRRNATAGTESTKRNPAVSAAGFRVRRTLRTCLVRHQAGHLVRDCSRQFRFAFWRRPRFKEPLALVSARARDIRRWSIFHKEPPSSRSSLRRRWRLARGVLEVSRSGLHRIPGPSLRRSVWSNTAENQTRSGIPYLAATAILNASLDGQSTAKMATRKIGNSGQAPNLPLSLERAAIS